MTLSPFPPKHTNSDRRWMLWVDGCGGFSVLVKSTLNVGRQSSLGQVDVGLIADVPRLAGSIVREQSDYYWHTESLVGGSNADESSSQSLNSRKWIEPGCEIEGLGSAKLRLKKPSALCDSAVLTLDPPHRFGGHIDAVLLVNQTWLIGPSDDCHIRCRSLSSKMIVSCCNPSSGNASDDTWWIKQGSGGAPQELPIGRRVTLGEASDEEITMLFELAI